MDNAKSKTEPTGIRSQGRGEWSSAATRLGIVLILMCSCFAGGVRGEGTNRGVASTAATVHKYLSDMDARGRGRNGEVITPEQVEEFEQGLTEMVKTIEEPPQEDTSAPEVSQRTVLASAAVVAGVIILVGTLLPRIGRIVNKRFEAYSTSESTSKLSAKVEAEEKEFEQFIERFQGGALSSGQGTGDGELSSLNRLQQFLAVAPEKLESIRSVFGQFGDVTDEEVRKTILGEMHDLLRRFKVVCEGPDFKPVWQLTTSLEELVKQLKERPNCITPSSLRTTAGALGCLEHLCKPGVRLDRAMSPPPRFLAVDDEPICRFAVSTALKRAFSDPDLAADGNAGLAKAKESAYDAIFVDVEMPGMDGFELCSKIHLTSINEKAPVVFVTSHSDFVSRKKSTEAGGYDLIAKPFLPLEFIVKAMTLILRHRLFPTVSKEATGVAETAEAAPEARSSDESLAPSRLGGEMVLGDRATAGKEPGTTRITREEPAQPEVAASNGASDTESGKDEEMISGDEATVGDDVGTTPEMSEEPAQPELAASNGVLDTGSGEDEEIVIEDQAEAGDELGTTPEMSEASAQPELAASNGVSDTESGKDEEMVSEDQAAVGNEVGATPEASDETAQPELVASGGDSDAESHEDEEMVSEDLATVSNGPDTAPETSDEPAQPELVASGSDSDSESHEDEEMVLENRAAAGNISGTTPEKSDEPPQPEQGASAGGSHTEKLRKLRVLSRQLRAVTLGGDTLAQQAALDEISLCLKPTAEEAVRRGLQVVSKVGLALGSLIKKLREQPKFATISALNTVAAALDLLDEFCVDPSAAEVGNSELQILVVDDDPVSRRMMGTALQLMFGRPDVADSGEDAVRVATHNKFDVIFMDVVMPKLDGFGACQKIREAGANQKTPVVFVTSETSLEAQDRGTRAGGNGFIPKPVMPAEIFVAATVFGYTGRLRARRGAVTGERIEQGAEREVRSGEPALES